MLVTGVDRQVRLAKRLAACFTDHRVGEAIKPALPDLLRERIFGLALGNEDLIDHDKSCHHQHSPPSSTSRAARLPASRHRTDWNMRRRSARTATTSLIATRLPSSGYLLICSWKLIARRQDASPSIWLPPMIHSTANKKVGIFPATTTATAICRSISPTGGIPSPPSGAHQTANRKKARARVELTCHGG